MKNFSLLAFGIICLLLPACQKSQITHYPINAALKAAFNFQSGSYWIYKDSLSGRIDSFFVTSNIENSTSQSTAMSTGQSFDDITIYISEYNTYPAPVGDTQSWKFIYSGNTINVFFNTKNIYTGFIVYIPLINYPFVDSLTESLGLEDGYYGYTAIVNNIYGSYTIDGQTFTNVAEINQKADLTWNGNGNLPTPYTYNDWFYITPNIGLIKIIQTHPQDSLYRVWELQRYHIIK